MSRSQVPPRLAAMSRGPTRLLGRGIPMGPLVLLRTRGRRTGQPRLTPVAPLNHDSVRYLVAPFGETGWVYNARAEPDAELGRGRHMKPVHLEELTGPAKAEVLRLYRRHYRPIPFVRAAFQAGSADGLAIFAAEADRHPVFIVRGRPQSSTTVSLLTSG